MLVLDKFGRVLFNDYFRSCAFMEFSQRAEPKLVDELPAINGFVSAIIPTSEETFLTGSQELLKTIVKIF